MKTSLQKELAKIAPHISIETIWERDEYARFSELTGPGDAFENEDPYDWQAWQSEIRATAIEAGEARTGHAYLCGTWEKAGDNPRESDPDISGYELQMTEEALTELAEQISDLAEEIHSAVAYVRKRMQEAYDAQQSTINEEN